MSEKRHAEDMHKLLLISFRKIIRTIDQHSRNLIKLYGLSIPQLFVLQEVVGSKGSTVSKLAKAVSLSQPTVTDIVERLLNRGLLTRSPSGRDRRSNIITITEKGIELLNKKPSLFPQSFLHNFDQLQDWEKTLLLSTIQRIVSMLPDPSVSPLVITEASLLNGLDRA